MSSFTRYAAVAAVVLSLGFLVASAPTPSYASVPAITGKDAVSLVCAKLLVGIESKIKALLACTTVAELQVAVRACVVLVQTCAEELIQVGAGVAVDADAKASIVACFASLITLLVQVCAHVSVKLGLSAVVTIFAELDACVRLLFVNLNICIGGILVLIAKALASVTVGLLAQVHFKLCLSVLGLAA